MSYETNDKMVSHPDHYRSGRYEVIDIIDEFTKDLSGTEAVCTANAIKYILRWKKKNGIQDVKKAIWYLQHLVDKEEERLREEAAEYNGPDEHCRTCKYRFDTPENDKICLNCFGREKYVPDEALVADEKVDMDKIMNPPTNEEIHSCDDCVFKTIGPLSEPCKSCDLHLNPPSNWVSEDKNVNVTAKQAIYASRVITKYCNSIGSNCVNSGCPFFDDNGSPVGCKFRLDSPDHWNFEEKK